MKVALLRSDTMLFGSQVPVPVHQTTCCHIPGDSNVMAAVCVQNVMKLTTVSQKLYRENGHTVQTFENRKLINATERTGRLDLLLHSKV